MPTFLPSSAFGSLYMMYGLARVVLVVVPSGEVVELVGGCGGGSASGEGSGGSIIAVAASADAVAQAPASNLASTTIAPPRHRCVRQCNATTEVVFQEMYRSVGDCPCNGVVLAR